MLWQRLPARSVRQVRLGSTRGVKPKTYRAITAVTQGQTGHPRADSTAPNPERRCGCGTRHDLRDNVGANDRFFSRSRLPEAKAAREPLLTLRPVKHVRPQAEPTRGSEPPPGHSHPVPRPPFACHNGTAPVARSVRFPPALPSAFASGCIFVSSVEWFTQRRRGRKGDAESLGRRLRRSRLQLSSLPRVSPFFSASLRETKKGRVAAQAGTSKSLRTTGIPPMLSKNGAPDGIRTHGPQIRN